MLVRTQHKTITWIDLESPTHAEVHKIVNEFGIDPFTADELLLPSPKPRAEFHSSYVYTILHFPALRHTHKSLEQEIDFVIGKDFLITVHYDTIDSLHKFSKQFEVATILRYANETEHAGHVFCSLMQKLYRAVEYEVDFVHSDLSLIEEDIFNGREVAMVGSISRSARDLLNLRQTIEPHREMLRTLEEDGPAFFGQDFAPYLRALSNEYYRVHNHIMRHTDSLHELRETNNSLITTKQNEIMKIFTILAFVTFPLSLIASIFGMNTQDDPVVGRPYDFWIVLGIMAFATAMMFWYFKHKRWL